MLHRAGPPHRPVAPPPASRSRSETRRQTRFESRVPINHSPCNPEQPGSALEGWGGRYGEESRRRSWRLWCKSRSKSLETRNKKQETRPSLESDVLGEEAL